MIIYHHLGLGDHFILYSLVIELTGGNGSIYCKKQNEKSVMELYYGTNIKLIVVNSDADVKQYDKKVGFTNDVELEKNFGETFYKQVGLKYKDRWKHKPILKQPIEFFIKYPEIVVCDSPEHIIDIEGYRPNGRENIFDYIRYLQNAKEIHCIESSFKQLIEVIETKAKLIYHFKKTKSWRKVKSKKKWQVVDY